MGVVRRLKPPHGRVNEAGYDAEKYFLSRHIHGKGSVKSGTRIDNTISLRQRTFDSVLPFLQQLEHKPLLVALGFGDRSLLTPGHWDVLRNSGLAHLMAISGLHIGLAFVFGWNIAKSVRIFGSDSRLFLWMPFYIGLGFACVYAWLAGFSLTTQRALVALLIGSLLLRLNRRLSSRDLLVIVMACCLAWDPLAAFSASFWLSFSAVGILAFVFSITPGHQDGKGAYSWLKSKTTTLLKMQLFLTVGMVPLQWLWFGGISVASIFINVLAVPWVSLVTVPSIFMAFLLSPIEPLAMFAWKVADLSLWPVWWLAKGAEGGWVPLADLPAGQIWMVPVVLVTLWLLPLRRFKVLVAAVLLIALGWKTAPQNSNRWRLDVLDVGHGLAVLIEKNGRAVLYDTGIRWPGGGIIQTVVQPVLAQRGINSPDGFIVSHSDSDHAAGAETVMSELTPKWARASDARVGYLPCIQDEEWEWQGLTFEVLWPPKLIEKAKNPDSCVIRVSDGSGSVMLTGDIDKEAEMGILASTNSLITDVLLAPHHGSKTSSTEEFISAVQPGIAIASTSLYNPWRLPAPVVVSRYRSQGIDWRDTGKEGQVSAVFNGESWRVFSQRVDIQPFWYRKMFGAAKRKE